MTVAGLNASQILGFLHERLQGIEGVATVYRGDRATTDVRRADTPSLTVRYAGSDWDYGVSRHVWRQARIQIIIEAAAGDYERAEDQLFIIQDRVKAWVRANEQISPEPGIQYASSARIVSDGPFELVDSPLLLRTILVVEVRWMERLTSEINSEARGNIGGPTGV